MHKSRSVSAFESTKQLLIIVLLISVSYSFKTVTASSDEMRTEMAVTRVSNVRVKVVIVGIPPQLVNVTYLKWNLPSTKYQTYLNPGKETGVQYRIAYNFTFPSKGFQDSFGQYLKSRGKVDRTRNPYLGANLTNTLYPADLTENWLKYHESDYSNSSEPGYTLMLANLTSTLPSVLPSQYDDYLKGATKAITPHYYNMTYVDSDLYVTIRRRWMTSWGGSSRIYFIDLSSGPSNTTRQLPLQWAMKANNITFLTPYGSRWLTQYLSDYVSGAVEDLFAPDLLYPLNIANRYTVDILVIDNRTDLKRPEVNRTLDSSRIRNEIKKLLPYAEVRVQARFINITSSTPLTKLIAASSSPSKYANTSMVDARPVYYWLSEEGEGHLKDFFNTTGDRAEYRIPVMAFIFTGEYQFGFTFKEDLSELPRPRSIWGVSLGDVILVGHSSHDLVRGNFTAIKQPNMGFGLTNTIIHEVGHTLGLIHPFASDSTENFVASVMAYYPYEYSYSQFDRDYLQRSYVDRILMDAKGDLQGLSPNALSYRLLSSINEELDSAERYYANMSYAEALPVSMEVRRAAAFARYVDNTVSVIGRTTLVVLIVAVGVILVVFISRYSLQTLAEKRVLSPSARWRRVGQLQCLPAK
jgi:hypothetical protein